MFNKFILLLVRILFSVGFINAAILKFWNWQKIEDIIITSLTNWQNLCTFPPFKAFFGSLIPWSSVIHAIPTSLELLGGLMLLFGFRDRIAACLLILFMVPDTTFLFHPFWFFSDGLRQEQMMNFFKNFAEVGALILIAINGLKFKSSRNPELSA